MYKNDSFICGESFYKVSQNIIPDDIFDKNDDWYWLIPSIVNLAFACECYLKSLLSDGNSQSTGHKLKELYERLPDNIKDEIIHSSQFNEDEEFEKQLEENSAVFIEWRYEFEEKEKYVDIGFLDKFADVLRDTAKKYLNSSNSSFK